MFSPNVELLIKNGCKPFFGRNGEVYKIVLNGEPGAKEPRLTITRSQSGFWRMFAEVSIGAWLFNSNIFLPNESDLERYFLDLSDFIFYKIGIRFDIRLERVRILDVTRDFNVGESKVLSILKTLLNVNVPKYNRRPFNDTSVYFENKGKVKNKVYKIYSKQHDFIDKRVSQEEIELAKGLLRLEIHHGDSRAVSNLAKSLKLQNLSAGTIITPQTSDKVINDAVHLLNLDALLNKQTDSPLEILASTYGSSMALTLAGHLAYKEKLGSEYYSLPVFNLTKETVKNYDRKCAKAGTLSL